MHKSMHVSMHDCSDSHAVLMSTVPAVSDMYAACPHVCHMYITMDAAGPTTAPTAAPTSTAPTIGQTSPRPNMTMPPILALTLPPKHSTTPPASPSPKHSPTAPAPPCAAPTARATPAPAPAAPCGAAGTEHVHVSYSGGRRSHTTTINVVVNGCNDCG